MKSQIGALALFAALAACGYEVSCPRNLSGTQGLAVKELKHHLALAADEVPYTFVFGRPDGAVEPGAFESRYLVRGDKVWFWGDDSVVASQKRNGTLFAVELFADNELGLKFLWPGEDGVVTTKPKAKVLALRDGAQGSYMSRLVKACIRNYPKDRRVPWDEVKDYMPRELYENAQRLPGHDERALWQKRNRLQDRESFTYGHAFMDWNDRFLKTHPEYLNLHVDEKTGKRIRGWTGDSGRTYVTKLCVSNEGVVGQIIADWCAGGTNRHFNICENDWTFWCECENCRALDVLVDGEKPLTHLTDRYLNLWNRIARKACRIRKDVVLVTYAYSAYRLPPRREKVEFGDNMLFGFVFGVSEDAMKLIGEWRRVGMRHFFFRPNYLCSWSTIHSGFERFYYQQFHEMLRDGLAGVDYDANPNRPTTALEYYVLARAFCDQTVSFEKIISDYCAGYGAAAEEVKAYLDSVRATGEARIEGLRQGRFEDEYDYGYRSKLPRSQEKGRNEKELAEKSAMLEAVVVRHEKAGDLSEAEMQRLKSLRFQAEHGLLTFRFLVSVADGTVAEMKSAADTLNAFRIAHNNDLRDNYDTIYRIWWGETRYWRVYLERLSSP